MLTAGARRIGVSLVMSLSILACAASRSSAQGNTSSLRGVVRDEQHLPVPLSSLLVESTDGGLQRSQTGRPDGSFEFPALQPGDYRLTVHAEGFQPKSVLVRVEVNQRVQIDVVLATKGVTESVEVIEATPLLHVNDAAVGEVVDQHQVAKLPLNGRQFLELALLVPGVHTSHGAQTGSTSALYWRPGQNSAISISGGRPNSNSYLLDGMPVDSYYRCISAPLDLPNEPERAFSE